METLIVVGLLVALALPVGVVVALVWASRLSDRVQRLERRATILEEELIKARQAQAAPRPEPLPDLPTPTAPRASAPRDAAAPPPVAEAAPPAAVIAGPWQQGRAAAIPEVPKPEPAAPDQNAALVFTTARLETLVAWVRVNWVYVVSAASLGLGGVFLVQYGIEQGLIPPGLRVLAALALGAGLILGGEAIRRRWGDDPGASTAYLPSVFSAAGLVTLFAAVVAARQLYGLIGPGTAFGGLIAVSALAVWLGWRHGPLLAAMGLLGAAAAPFLVAGGSEAGAWLYGYYALVAATGLAVDAVRRWAWISVLALALGYLGGGLVLAAGGGSAGLMALATGLAVLAVALPVLSLVPRHEGPAVGEALVAARRVRPAVWPPFPVRLAAGAALVSSLVLASRAPAGAETALLAAGLLAGLALLYLLWAEAAPGLWDLAMVPALAFLALILWLGIDGLPLARDFALMDISLRPPETAPPRTVTLLLAMAAAISAGFAFRALRPGPNGVALGLGAAFVAPAAAGILEFAWRPAPVLGAGAWAFHIMAVAAALAALSLRFAAVDGEDRRRAAHAGLAALSTVALALFLMLSDMAFALSLGVLILVAAGLDRRFRLAEMSLFIQAATAVMSWRFAVAMIDGWPDRATLPTLLVAFGGGLATLVATMMVLRPLGRPVARGAVESLAMVLAGLFVNVLADRWLSSLDRGDYAAYWRTTLFALPWLMLMLAQLHRAGTGAALARLRRVLAALAGLAAGAMLLAAALPQSPLNAFPPDPDWDQLPLLVLGWPALNTLAVAYLLPGAILLTAAWRMPVLPRWLRIGLGLAGAALAALFAGLAIRHLWHGPNIGLWSGVTQPEMYSYTVALILLGAAMLYQAIARRSALLRRLAMGVIALAAAKVFLLDASGLSGLTRVASFLGLGLALAGLAWLNRWAGRQAAE